MPREVLITISYNVFLGCQSTRIEHAANYFGFCRAVPDFGQRKASRIEMEHHGILGSGLVDHNQKEMAAAMQMADIKVRVAIVAGVDAPPHEGRNFQAAGLRYDSQLKTPSRR